MSLYFLDYDLRAPGRNYKPLYDELARFGAHRMLQSSWFFKRTGTNAVHLRDHFKQFIDSNDGLWVAEVASTGSAWATYRTQSNPNTVVTG